MTTTTATSPTTFPLLNRDPITFQSAARHEDHIINHISWFPATQKLYGYLWAAPQRRAISSLTALHLGLDPERQFARCVVQQPETWIRGSFNVCIPVHVQDDSGRLTRKVLMRCPMAHKLAEHHYPGTVDEKLSSEVSTYIWMQQHCHDVPIANLLGFGFTDGRHFAQVCRRPFYIRWGRAIWQKLRAFLQLPVPSQYIRTPSNYFLRTGYVILDYIEPTTGQMLSATWQSHSDDTQRRQNLFRGLSRLILSVSRIPLPRIASWRFH
ncbi:hypothetical protein TOPH_02888 [Tolypocladium ophioglossoides CBS 100239]|uniref:Uncharacterized protein n=1 Tax=Tolypocladium ophioglossoides (strain CBS 100239) TaxID=1163406 RepID=A0A0L0NF09_TOLOC|nr:hypothetical protein TOPH_02888 [Tolypocladium ophioglossoides CBS 100239]